MVMELGVRSLLLKPSAFISFPWRHNYPPAFVDAGQLTHLFLSNRRFKCNPSRMAVSSLPTDNGRQTNGKVMNSSSMDEVEQIHHGEEDGRMVRVCDKLIEVFLVDKPSSTDWRRLLAFSRDWGRIRPQFFVRCYERAESETNLEMKQKLLRLARKLKEIDEDVQRHDELIDATRNAQNEELIELVSRRRKDFTTEFFNHLFTVTQSYRDRLEDEQALVKLGNKLVNAVAAYDNASETVDRMSSTQTTLHEIMNSPTVGDAFRKIDDLSLRSQPDTALAMILAKAWSAAKGTDVTKDEVKDIMYHMYMRAMDQIESQMPKDARIAKHLMKIKDPERRMAAMADAFTPGEEGEGQNVEYIYTTPRSLHSWLTSVIDAYHSKNGGALLREARDLMNPKKIHLLEELKKQIEQKFF